MDGNREFAVSETFSGLDGDGPWVGGPGLVGSLWRYRLVIVAVTALAAIAGYAVSLLLPAKYEAQASLFLRDPGSPAVLTLGGSPHPSRATTPSSWPPRPSSPAPMWCTSGRCRSSSAAGHPTTSGARWWWGPRPTSRRSRSVPPRVTRRNPRTWPRRSAPPMSRWPASASPRTPRRRSRGLQQVRAQREAEFDALRAQIAQTSGPDQATLERKALHMADLIGGLQVHQSKRSLRRPRCTDRGSNRSRRRLRRFRRRSPRRWCLP